MFKRLLIITAIAFLATSCSKRLMPPEVVQKDSIVYVKSVEMLKDTVIVLAPDSSLIRALLECDSTNNVRIKEIMGYRSGKDLSPPKLSINNNVLTAQANLSERRLLLYYKQKYVEMLKEKSQTVTKTVVVNELYWYQKALMYTGIGALILIILLIIKKFK